MKYVLLIIIKLYWVLIPKHKRRHCIFKKSCSKYVYDITLQYGLKEGLKAFHFRYKNCRNEYELFENPLNGEIQIILPNKNVIKEKDISSKLIINSYTKT